eukprot:GFUD01012360.1.p1 GENE.GFUD01012360.1~~GFUD01012360.1.p1  ORF type:complete len:1412 (-),score=414.50 GFUD01012360.1:12-4247(-)
MMNSQHEKAIAPEEVKSSDIIATELAESKSGRKIKPNRRIYGNYEETKKSKSEGFKKTDSKYKSKKSSSTNSNAATATGVPEIPVDKTPAVEIPTSTKAMCGYCHKGHQEDPLESGKMFSINGVITHYFCMLFTYNSNQFGADSEGLFGFFGEEVKQQIENGQKKLCKYCSKPGATSRCKKKRCGVMMHFPCGQEVGATFQFTGKMTVYCKNHRVKQKVETFPTPPDTDCVICYETVEQEKMENFRRVRAPCCGRHLHRNCVQRFAMSSGTQHFKCPNCNNKDDILKDFKKLGIYIPYKDAEWELPAQSSFYNFQDMYVQTKRCFVKECICKEEEGRSYNDVDGEFEIVLCDMCGTNGVHIKCAKVNEDTLDYACVDCGGDVALEERTFESGNASLASSTLNLSLASTVDESLGSDKESTSSSISSIRDFVKQFEIGSFEEVGSSSNSKNNDSLDSLLDTSESGMSLTSLFNTTEESVSSASDGKIESGVNNDNVQTRPYKKRGPKSKTQVANSSPVPVLDVQPALNVQSKHNFFKHTEEITKMLEDLKKREQEKKAKDAFLKSLAEAQASEKKVATNEKNKDNSYEFGKYLAKSLGKGEKNKVVAEEIQRKINEIAINVSIPNLEDPQDVPIDMEPTLSMTMPFIKVRTDLIAGTALNTTNIMDESKNVYEVTKVFEQIIGGDSGDASVIAIEDVSIEISEKRQKFGSFLLTKEHSKLVAKKKDSSYIDSFYKHLEPTVTVQPIEANKDIITESSDVVTSMKEQANIVQNSLVSADVKEISDEEELFAYEDDNEEIPEENDSDISNLGLEIVDSFTCSDSFIDELLDSPVKSADTEVSEVAKQSTHQEDEEINDNDAPGTNLIGDLSLEVSVPSQEILPPQSIQVEAVPAKEESVSNIKYKPGPRSRTRPNQTETERTSSTKIKESIAENIKMFEEQAKALKSKSLDVVELVAKISEGSKATADTQKVSEETLTEKESNEKLAEENEPEPTVRYKPGPKSRKKYLVVKDDQTKENKTPALSPKRSSDSSHDQEAKKQKTEGKTTLHDSTAEVVSLDSSTSSEESTLEVIDLDSPEIEVAKTPTDNLNKLDASTLDVVATSIAPVHIEIISTELEDSVKEIRPSTTNVSATPDPGPISKRASKRPFQCPVCQGFFRSEMVLQQHLAKIHFWNRLLALPKEATTASGPAFQCSEFPCRYIHKSKNIVAGHLATEHKVVFRIALGIFPDFKLPVLNTSTDITIIASVPAKLPQVSSQPAQTLSKTQTQAATLQSQEHSSKRSASSSRPDLDDQTKKSKTSQSLIPTITRPIILPSQPHKAVARVKPRTAAVNPTILRTAESPLKPAPASLVYSHSQYPPHPPQPFTTQAPPLAYPSQGYFYPGYPGQGYPAPAPGQYVDTSYQYNSASGKYNC